MVRRQGRFGVEHIVIEPDDNPIITVADVMAAGFCPPGIVKWMREKGMDYRKFRNGEYRLSDFEDVMDGYAEQVVRHIKQNRGEK